LTGSLGRLGHPAIHTLLKAAPGEADLQQVQVTLPSGELLDNSHFGEVCTKVKFAAHSCPKRALLGKATVTTPLLDEPLKGNVYLRSSSRGLPDLAFDLRGQFDIEVVGRVDSFKGGLRTTFSGLPDAPISSFELNLLGGSKGLLQNSESLCGKSKSARVRMAGQNGIRTKGRIPLKVSCGKASKRQRHNAGAKGGRWR
jgi:hypothetical protein